MSRNTALAGLFFLTLAATGCVAAAPKLSLPRFDANRLRALQAEGPTLAKRYRRYAAVYDAVTTMDEHRVVDTKWSMRALTLRRYVVVDPKSRWVGRFSWRLGKHWRFEQVQLSVLSAKGDLRHYGLSDLHVEKKGGGARVYKLAYPRIDKGAVVEERVVRVLSDCFEDRPTTRVSLLSSTIPIRRREHHLVYPKRWRVQAKKLGRALPLQVVPAEGGRYRASYRRNDVPAVPKEPYAPPFRHNADYLKVRLQYVSVHTVDIYASPSWEALAKTFRRYVINEGAVFSRRLETLVAKLIAGKASRIAKARAILRYAQETLQVGDWAKRDFADVLSEGKGTRVQITAMVAKMLRAAGLKAEFALVRSAKEGNFDEEFVSVSEVSVPVVVADLGGAAQTLIIPHLRHLDIGHVPWWLEGQRGLLMRRDGSSSWFRAPRSDAKDDRTEVALRVSVNDNGNVIVEETQTLRGVAGWRVRRKLADGTKEEVAKELWDRRSADAAEKLSDPRAENLTAPHLPVVLRYRYRLPSAAALTPKRAIVRFAGLLQARSRRALEADPKQRRRPVFIARSRLWHRKVELRLPPGWTLEKMPRAHRVKNPLGAAKVDYRLRDDRVLEIEKVLELIAGEHPAERIVDLVALFGAKGEGRVPPLVFRRRAPKGPAPEKRRASGS